MSNEELSKQTEEGQQVAGMALEFFKRVDFKGSELAAAAAVSNTLNAIAQGHAVIVTPDQLSQPAKKTTASKK